LRQRRARAGRDLLTLHLKNVTVFEALDALRETYGYEYSVAGTRIYVEPPELQTRLYQVNYMLGQRRGVSDLQVVAGAVMGSGGSSSGSGSGSGSSGTSTAGGGSSGASYSSSQASALSTVSKSDMWGEMEDSLRTIMGCLIPTLQAAVRAGGQGAGGSSSGGGSSRADVSFVGDAQLGERLRGVGGCLDGRAVNVNQMTGTVLVRGMPRELRTVERLLRTMQINVERQVIIEAKVIDVQLNSESQQGINWAAFSERSVEGGDRGRPETGRSPWHAQRRQGRRQRLGGRSARRAAVRQRHAHRILGRTRA
jgi:MSHA biogenesis protein MshL